ncbi:DUF1345 domain-containing protein [Actinotalea sp. JY-7885]|uniref:DUF1345 domain-containing protein n=1 Tax=Actinotalea sp. JY-7885 TaxID=2758576 RepID=UPI00165E6A4A|nr:DUF1345 domain-containing protein [Actinotalea sp. JY-7885]
MSTLRARAATARRLVRDALLPETRRSGAAFVVALGVLVAQGLTLPADAPTPPSGLVADTVLLALTAYQGVHVLLTLTVYAGAPQDVLDRAVARMPVGGFVNRWVYFAEPGTGAALVVAVLAMGAAVVVLPQAGALPSSLPPGVLTALAVVLIVASWSTMVLTFALDYLRRDHGDGAARPLRFVDDDERTFADYLYVATSVATTFGTGDVTVAGTALRRVVTGQVLVAFVFNAVIIGLTVSLLAALRA